MSKILKNRYYRAEFNTVVKVTSIKEEVVYFKRVIPFNGVLKGNLSVNDFKCRAISIPTIVSKLKYE